MLISIRNRIDKTMYYDKCIKYKKDGTGCRVDISFNQCVLEIRYYYGTRKDFYFTYSKNKGLQYWRRQDIGITYTINEIMYYAYILYNRMLRLNKVR